jgi:hypothetical protein
MHKAGKSSRLISLLSALPYQCSEEVVVIGVLRVVEEIMNRRPNAKIVINSMFPMTAIRGGLYPVISDFEDSFGLLGNRRSLFAGAAPPSAESTLEHSQRRALRKKSRPTTKNEASSQELSEEIVARNMTAEAQKEEEQRDVVARKKRKKVNGAERTNPVMTDRDKVRKYEFRDSPKPLWTSIRAINRSLREFAAKNKDRVQFFDATNIFTAKVGKSFTLLTDRISVRGHPTVDGFRRWEDAIVTTLENILAAMKKDQPQLFTVPNGPTGTEPHTKVKKQIDGSHIPDNDNDEYADALRPNYDDSFPPDTKQSGLFSEGDDSTDDATDEGDLVVSKPLNDDAAGADDANDR